MRLNVMVVLASSFNHTVEMFLSLHALKIRHKQIRSRIMPVVFRYKACSSTIICSVPIVFLVSQV